MTTKDSPISFVERSSNVKIGKSVSATYAPIKQTCPESCKLRDTACYAQVGNVGGINARISRNAAEQKLSATRIAELEAEEIDKSFKGGKIVGNGGLRLHVSGDVRTQRGVGYLSRAAQRFQARGGGKVWTYTHAWSKLPRHLWKGISVLASCDTIQEARAALRAGYAPAMVVAEFEQDSSYLIDGIRGIPCPAQTRDTTCEACKLCMNADRLASQDSMILFAVHGVRAKKFKLNVLQRKE
jgi:hypothetical protein